MAKEMKPKPVTDPKMIEKLEKRGGVIPKTSDVADSIEKQLLEIKNIPNTWCELEGIRSGSYVNRIIRRRLGEALVSKGGKWLLKRIKEVDPITNKTINKIYAKYVQ